MASEAVTEREPMSNAEKLRRLALQANAYVDAEPEQPAGEGKEKPASDLATFAEARAKWEKENPHAEFSTTEDGYREKYRRELLDSFPSTTEGEPTAPGKKWTRAALEEWTPEQWADALDAARTDLMCAEDFEPSDVAHVMDICAQVLRRAREPEKRFPILGAGESVTIPWSVAERAYLDYSKRYGSEQSLERLAERGGLSEGELDKHLPGWRDLVWPREQGEPIGYIEETDIGHPRGYVHLTPNPSRVAVYVNPTEEEK